MILIETAIDFERQLLTITVPATDDMASSAHTISLARPDPATFPAEDHHPDFTLWGGHVDGYSVGTPELRAALSAYMGRPVLLVQRGEELREASATGFVQGLPGASFEYNHHPSVSFSDEYPILLTSQDSIAELDRRIINDKEVHEKYAKQFDAAKWKNGGVQPVQFRGNILVEGTKEAWDEDWWAEVVIGEEREDAVPLIVAQRCARCQVSLLASCFSSSSLTLVFPRFHPRLSSRSLSSLSRSLSSLSSSPMWIPLLRYVILSCPTR